MKSFAEMERKTLGRRLVDGNRAQRSSEATSQGALPASLNGRQAVQAVVQLQETLSRGARAAAQSHLAATLSLRTLQPQSANNSVLQAEWIELGSPDLVVWNEILDGVTWYADAQGLMWFEITDPQEIRLGTLEAFKKLEGSTHKRSYESWDELEQIEAPDIEQRFEEITAPSRESPEEEIKEQLVSTKHIYAPLTADASLETYNKTVEDLKGSRRSLATAAEKISGEENKLVFTTAIDLITILRKLKKAEGTEWKGAIATLNTAGAAYVKAILIIQKNEPKAEQAEETTTSKAIRAIQDQTLLQMMATDQLLADPVIRSRIENEGGGSFGWTNAKGEVGEFYGKQTLEELGREKTRSSGGNFKIINVVVTSNESGSNPRRIKEIDGLEVEISGKKYVLRGIYEIKTTTEGKSNLRGELTTSLSAKSKALRDAQEKGNRIWTKEGEVLKEDITNMLIVPHIDKLTIQTVGPVRSDQARYDVVFNKNINKITDQIACLWLQQHPSKTIKNIQLGTGKASAFAQFKS